MRRLLLFGGTGQVGQAFQSAPGSASWEIVAPSSGVVPLTSASELRSSILSTVPEVIVNCAAFTGVDAAETDRATVFAINAHAPGVMAECAQILGARLLHISTDYVFDGSGDIPYLPVAPTRPLNVYGESKAAAERVVLSVLPEAVVIRTSWVHSGTGANFVKTAVRNLACGTPMRVVDDQIGVPTHATTVADCILRILERSLPGGILHVTDAGVASWYDVACCVLDVMQRHGRATDMWIEPVPGSAFPRPALRPKISVLATHESRRVLDWTPRNWRDGVSESTTACLASH